MLQNALSPTEEEELVLDDVAANVTAKLVALEGRLYTVHIREAGVVILEVIKRISVEGIGPGASGNEHLAGRRDFTRHVLR